MSEQKSYSLVENKLVVSTTHQEEVDINQLLRIKQSVLNEIAAIQLRLDNINAQIEQFKTLGYKPETQEIADALSMEFTPE